MNNPQTELDDLIQWWRNSYAINYVTREPLANERILKTIKALEKLRELTYGNSVITLKII